MDKYEFDARRYCQNNRDRMGHMPDGSPVADLIICEIDSRNVRIEALKMRLAEVEAQRDGLKETLELVTSLWPSMEEIDDDRSGAWWSRPSAVYLLKRARKALAKLEETK